jgi:cell division protein FtsZ
MKDSGVAIMGSAAVEGEDRAIRCVTEALDSPLLNDNNIAGAKFVLLNITYGDKEVLMDEITEITDFIQDEAGSSADVIWGHGYDPTLGEKLSVTLIATGFNSSPITGFEKAPEKIVRPLHEEPKNEIVSQLVKPTEVAPKAEPTPSVENNNEPFLKTVEPTLEVRPTVRNWVDETAKPTIEPQKETESVSLVWEVETTTNQEVESIPVIEVKTPVSDEKIVHTLELDDAIVPLENSIRTTPKTHMSPEEQLKIQQERMERLHAYTQKLKKADGLTQLEKEPAFERRNIQLDQSRPSTENSVSRFGVSGSGDNISLRSNNSFLHDNVD